MKICITLDDVLRAKTEQIIKMYKKYIDPEIDTDALDVSTNDMKKVLGIESQKEYNRFLYTDYPFEIFAEANTVERMADKRLNLWMLSFKDNESLPVEPQVIIANPFEFNLTIGNTCMFLAKCATRCREFYFPTDSLTIWDRCDVLVTAEPKLLNNKPEGKTAIKIETTYNTDCPADKTYEGLIAFLDDNDILTTLTKKYDGVE